jgi:diguanylate cyclase (GGDEF)-like protein
MQVASSFSYLKKYRVEQKLKLASNHDPLTGSYNRRYFFESGEIIFQKNKRKTSTIAVIMLDIDNFKKINDTYGHSVGDIAIKEVPIILGANLRETDLVARFGGEEFCILLEDISLDKTKKLANRIVKLFKDNHILIANNEKINYTVSLGVAYGTSNSLTNMINLSDGALYESKNNGKNTYTAYDLMTNNKIQLFEVTRSYPCP